MDIVQFVKENLGKEIAFKNCDNPKGTATMKGMVVGYDSNRIEILVSYTDNVGWSPAEIVNENDIVLLHSPLNVSYGYIFPGNIINTQRVKSAKSRKDRIVILILFDVMYKGIVYKDLDMGYHGETGNECITEDYIHDEDGPWGIVEVGNDLIDFQIFAEPDAPEKLEMQACLMYKDEDGAYQHGNLLDTNNDIIISNIRVSYREDSPFPVTEKSTSCSPISPITWNGKEYPSKNLVIFKGTEDEQEVTVSIEELQNELIDAEIYAPVSDEAEEVDGDIYYYLSESEMSLPDNEIIAIVEKA